MASAAAHGSDSHDAPLLFVLLCESSVRLCLPRSFLSARCLGGKVLLFSFSSALDLSLALPFTALSTRWTALFTSFTPSLVAFYLPRTRRRPALLLKMWTRSHCPRHLSKLLLTCCASVSSLSPHARSPALVFSFTWCRFGSFLPCRASVNLHLTSCLHLNGQTFFFFLTLNWKTCFLSPLFPDRFWFSMLILFHLSVLPWFLVRPRCLYAFTCCVGAVSADYDLGQLRTERELEWLPRGLNVAKMTCWQLKWITFHMSFSPPPPC